MRIRRRVFGDSLFSDFESQNTDGEGRFEIEAPVEMSADYIAVASGHDNCADATSSSESVVVKVSITIRASRRSVARGGQVAIAGRVSPDHPRTDVVLQRRKGGRFVRVARDELDGRSRYRFVVEAKWKGRRTFRVLWKVQDEEHASNRSDNVVVRTRRR